MSPSSSDATPHVSHRRHGRFTVAALVIVGIALFYFLMAVLPDVQHESRGREINRMGAELLEVLDSYGPIAPAKGSRDESGVSDLYDAENDPTRRWTYFGEARFAPEASGDDLSLAEAFNNVRAELADRGWSGGQPSRLPIGGYIYSKGEWNITLFYGPESDDDDFRDRIAFSIKGPPAGGPRPA